MRRLAAALSNAPLKTFDKPGMRQSPAAKEASRKVREVRKVMKAGGLPPPCPMSR
ncbi:MAG: hypothetical protein IJG38_06155 [Thermoguttaceae bacterium]|nr:hypothetical protein [Thermoguttaceae bacterium]